MTGSRFRGRRDPARADPAPWPHAVGGGEPALLPVRGAAVRGLGLPLPERDGSAREGPAPRLPLFRGTRPLKRWRYVGAFGPDLMLCAGDAAIGPLRQRWWAVAERDGPLVERTALRLGGLELAPIGDRGSQGLRLRIASPALALDLAVEEGPTCEPVEVVSPSGRRGWVWTRKQVGLAARGWLELRGRRRELELEAVVDDTAGYHERHTAWRWSAGVGRASSGERVGWNLVTGVHDSPSASERTLWLDGRPTELGPVRFADDLSRVTFAEGGALELAAWTARRRRTNLLLVRSSYRQPFGTFSGELPGGLHLAEGHGVMEEHEAWW